MCVGNRATSVVVEMRLDVATDHAPQGTNQVVNLAWRCTADRIRHADTVNAQSIDSPIKGEQIHEIGSERVLGGETDFNASTISPIRRKH
jgi:hypothetical protein